MFELTDLWSELWQEKKKTQFRRICNPSKISQTCTTALFNKVPLDCKSSGMWLFIRSFRAACSFELAESKFLAPKNNNQDPSTEFIHWFVAQNFICFSSSLIILWMAIILSSIYRILFEKWCPNQVCLSLFSALLWLHHLSWLNY